LGYKIYVGPFPKITKVTEIFGDFLHCEIHVCIGFDKKMDWATFWAIFSQTHLAALSRPD
jgi:hypothetical protein